MKLKSSCFWARKPAPSSGPARFRSFRPATPKAPRARTPNRRSSMHREALEFERTQASIRGCKTICNWLAVEDIPASYGEQIIEEARRPLAIAEENNTLPRDAAPPDMPTAMIIQRCRPDEPKTDAISFVAWFAHWLSLWAAYSMTDAWVRYKAIELALENQLRR